MSGWNDLIQSVARSSLAAARNAGRDGGPGASAPMHGAGPGFNRSYTADEVTDGLALGGLIPEHLLDSKVRMRTDSGGRSTVMAWVRKIARADKDELAGWQKRLYAAGLYEDTEPVYGYFDQATAGALSFLATEVLRNANRYTPTQILDIFTSSVDLDGDGRPDAQGGRDPSIITTNPLDLRLAAQDRSVDLLGRRIEDAEADQLMSGYTSLEQAEGQASVAGGQTTAGAPSLGAYAENQVRSANATEVDSYAALGAFNELLRMVGLAG